MGDIESLSAAEAVAKMKHIAEGQIAMLCTFPAGTNGSTGGANVRLPAWRTRPMGTAAVDDDGTFWFMSKRSSQKNADLAANAAVQLIYAVPGKSEYLNLEGRASVTRDQAKIDQLWTPIANNWFEGKDDPEITLIRVTPTAGYYWDTKTTRAIQLVKMAIGAVTGKEMDDGVEGSLRV